MSGFIANTAKIITGNAVSLLVILLTLPVITRLFEPDIYGQLVIFNSLISLLVTLTGLGYEKAFLIPKHDRTASLVLVVSLISVAAISCLYAIALVMAGESVIYKYFPEDLDILVIYLAPLAVALFGVTRVLMFWEIRKNRFTSQAMARVGSTVVEKISMIGVGILTGSVLVLIYTRMLGLVTNAGILMRSARTDFPKWKSIRLSRMLFLAIRFKNFWYSSLSAFLNALTRELPYLIIAAMFSTATAAFFGLARGAIGNPLMQLSDALTRAFYQKIMKAMHNEDDLVRICSDLLRIMIVVAAVPAIFVLLLGDIIVPIVFGSAWKDAGAAIGIVCVSFFSAAIYRPISVLFDMLERQRSRVVFNVLLLVFGILALFVGGQSGDPLLAMIYYVISVSAIYFLGIIYLFGLIDVSIYKSSIIILRPIIYSIAGIYIPISLVLHAVDSKIIVIGLSMMISAIYFYLVYYYDSSLHEYVSKAMKNRNRYV